MIVLIALAALAQATPAPSPLEADILVIGRRLDQLSVVVGKDARGKFTCSLSETSGNAGLDRNLCKSAAKCVKDGARDQAGVSACIDRRKPALLADVRRTLASGAAQ